jgi:hypothetical protein
MLTTASVFIKGGVRMVNSQGAKLRGSFVTMVSKKEPYQNFSHTKSHFGIKKGDATNVSKTETPCYY